MKIIFKTYNFYLKNTFLYCSIYFLFIIIFIVIILKGEI